jgi:hypothetical protein
MKISSCEVTGVGFRAALRSFLFECYNSRTSLKGTEQMPKYMIERTMPGAGDLTPQQLQAASQTSCAVLRELGPQIQWLETFVTPNKVYCVFIAPNEEVIREHARLGGFAADSIAVITEVVDPSMAESCSAVLAGRS